MRELFQQTIRETSLNVVRWEIDSIRRKSITKSGCRVFRDGLIGLAGTLGEPDETTWREAEANLAERVPYPYLLTAGSRRTQDLRSEPKSDAQITTEMADCLKICRERYPRLLLSNKVNVMETESILKNDGGTELCSRDRFTVISLLIKHVDSVGIMDSFIATAVRQFDPDAFLKLADHMLATFETPAALPKTDRPLIIGSTDELLGKLTEELSGRKIGRQASLFSGKVGQKLFGDTFSLWRDATGERYGEPFFDMEGTTLPGDRLALIENGIVRAPYADKKTAAEYGFGLTASAGGAYDDVPTLDSRNLMIAPSGRSLKELLGGEPAILVIVASGGDFTQEGLFATPVQMAMLTDGERILGRLPEFSLSSSLYDMFGSDFVGVASDRPFTNENLFVCRMKRS
jgi:PmbA protein